MNRPAALACKRGHGELIQDKGRQGYFCRECDYAVSYEDIMRGSIP